MFVSAINPHLPGVNSLKELQREMHSSNKNLLMFNIINKYV